MLDHLALRCLKKYLLCVLHASVQYLVMSRVKMLKIVALRQFHPHKNDTKTVLNCSLFFSDGDGGCCSGGDGRGSSSVFHLPADFFHPAAAAHPGSPGNGVTPGDRGPSRLASPASWASLRSPGANSRPLSSQVSWTDEWAHVCLDG